MTESIVDAALTRVATAAFFEDMGEAQFMALNCVGLIAFGYRNDIPREAINAAWSELQRRYIARQEERSRLADRLLPPRQAAASV
jgi:hypothetical protein